MSSHDRCLAVEDSPWERVRPEQFQIFDLYALKGMPAEVAAVLGVSVARVDLWAAVDNAVGTIEEFTPGWTESIFASGLNNPQ